MLLFLFRYLFLRNDLYSTAETQKASILSILIAYLYVRYLTSDQSVNGPAGMLVYNTLFHVIASSNNFFPMEKKSSITQTRFLYQNVSSV